MQRTSATSSARELPPLQLVETPAELMSMLDHLLARPRVAVDTEADSLFSYHYKVCLIQFSIPGLDYLVDPLALADLRPLGALFSSSRVEKVLHAAENDILMLQRNYGFQFAHLFDTMIAARILGWPRVGLAALLQEHFGVRLDKRMQLTNWGKRPLSPKQLAYARLDTHYLLPLRDRIYKELVARDRWEEAQDAFVALSRIEFVDKPFDPNGFWRIEGAHRLTGQQLAVLRELYLWREECARHADLPPFKIASDRTLILLSRQQPSTSSALERFPGLSPLVRAHFSRELLKAIRRGQVAPIPVPPSRLQQEGSRPDAATRARYDALRSWRTHQAAERGVDPDVVLTNEVLWRIAWRNPRSLEELAEIGSLSPWKLRAYGLALLAVIAGRPWMEKPSSEVPVHP
ncbi:MAG: HRDC domain-containing protein [Anaerolineae bacterium]|nr:HRDC domain-containing protein [Anaerolineae bacterium]MDW8099616.1 HRDC domain-containing protein [Anaerolineae bacterium]